MDISTIPLFKVFMSENAKENVNKVLSSGMITQGPQVEKFEQALKEFFDYPYVLTVNSATSGLTLAYRLLNLEKGDEVISTPLTCFATNAAIMANDLNIVWADVDDKTCNIDLANVLTRLTKDTKVLCIVHWGGNPVNMDQVSAVVEHAMYEYGNELYVIEDCAHAFGAEWNGRKLGTMRNTIAVYSTQAIKHLTTGDGGVMLLPNEEMYNRAKLLRWYGIDRQQRSNKDFRLEADIPEWGYKFHMNDINASIGLGNLSYITENLQKCAENGAYYEQELKGILGLELFERPTTHMPYYWIYTIKILFNLKNDFIEYMKNRGIIVSQVHARNDINSCMKNFSKKISNLPNLNRLEKQVCSIPVGWWITKNEREYIVKSIREFFNENVRIEQLQAKDIEKYQELLFSMNCYMSDKCNVENIKGVYVIKGKNEELISTAKLHVEKKIYDSLGHIQDVVTNTRNRNRGYGKALINFLKEKAMKEGCYKIVLSSIAETSDFYRSCGFVRSGYSYTYRKEPSGVDLFDEVD